MKTKQESRFSLFAFMRDLRTLQPEYLRLMRVPLDHCMAVQALQKQLAKGVAAHEAALGTAQ